MDSLPFIVFSCIFFHSNLQLYPVATFDYQRITMDPNFPEISRPSKRPSAAAFPSEPAPADSGRARSIHKTGRQDELQTGVGQGLELLGASTSKNVFLLHVKVTVISPSPKNWFEHWKDWNYLASKRMSFLEHSQNGSNPVDGHPSVGWSTKWPVAPKSETGSNVAQVKQAGTLFFDGLFLPTWRSWVSHSFTMKSGCSTRICKRCHWNRWDFNMPLRVCWPCQQFMPINFNASFWFSRWTASTRNTRLISEIDTKSNLNSLRHHAYKHHQSLFWRLDDNTNHLCIFWRLSAAFLTLHGAKNPTTTARLQ